MEKAYDRLEWNFISLVLRKFGFHHQWIAQVERCWKDICFSILINGRSFGFFQATRGIRQGDPLSPSIFILAAEVFSRGLTQLFSSGICRPYSLPRQCPTITHLFFADDAILFLNGRYQNVRNLLTFIRDYEAYSGQKVNQSKIVFIAPAKTSRRKAHRLSILTGFSQGFLPTTYLGIPLSKGKIKNAMLHQLVHKITRKIEGWKARLLNPAAKLTLIKIVLSSMPIHLLSAVNIPKSVLSFLNHAFANFFWGSTEEGPKKHWIKWTKLCTPLHEGGLGIRQIEDVMYAARFKMCWNLLQYRSLWACFFAAKFFWKFIFHGVVGSASSPTWKEILSAMPTALHHSRWLDGEGKISVWIHNWSGCSLLAAATVRSVPPSLLSANISDFFSRNGHWDFSDIHDFITPLQCIPSLPPRCHCLTGQTS